MKKILTVLASLIFFLSACDNKQSEEKKADVEEIAKNADIAPQVEESPTEPVAVSGWDFIAGEPEKFETEYNKLSAEEKYYFCAAFSMGAMSVSKPQTASMMVNYFMGLGVVSYNRGIDEQTYKAFDFGKNMLRYELVVNDILEKKYCENIIISATENAKNKNVSTEEINKKGEEEVKKIVDFIKQ